VLSSIQEIRDAPEGRQHNSGGHGIMASDGIEQKLTKPGLGPDAALAEEAARVIEVTGVISGSM